jgi:uncharacterized protein with von Willebrand factor type A (vWA) domain
MFGRKAARRLAIEDTAIALYESHVRATLSRRAIAQDYDEVFPSWFEQKRDDRNEWRARAKRMLEET